ncbi:MAG: nickel pincer cofactor biosynthesis protein LarC [Candidatus Omnitrophica bacterium]|nr:nickel pincer cofactor biosynthesis protein LarC [Candidatus Omnitrophota bacterium]
MRIAYFDCFSGISGDMALGAILDAGLDMKTLSSGLKKLHIKGYTLKRSKARRGEITGTKFDCVVTKNYTGHRSLGSIMAIIDKSSLSAKVKTIAKDIFNKIGAAEAKIHGRGAGSAVYLHELGSIDSIVDIAGIAIALDALGIDEVYASAINMGRAFAKTGHGNLPIPAPAALELMKGVPVKILDIDAELVTPTGAGILKALARGFGAMPPMKISGIGYGAGSRIVKEIPNMLRVIIGETEAVFDKDRVIVAETNIDDMNPQHIEYVFEKLLGAGALDVCSTAIQMKKTRPAFKLTVICKPEDLGKLSDIIFRETTTIGIRYHEAGRLKLERKMVRARTEYGNVRVKVSSGPDGILRAAPEYDDCVRIARAKKVPLRLISDQAKEIARENH